MTSFLLPQGKLCHVSPLNTFFTARVFSYTERNPPLNNTNTLFTHSTLLYSPEPSLDKANVTTQCWSFWPCSLYRSSCVWPIIHSLWGLITHNSNAHAHGLQMRRACLCFSGAFLSFSLGKRLNEERKSFVWERVATIKCRNQDKEK